MLDGGPSVTPRGSGTGSAEPESKGRGRVRGGGGGGGGGGGKTRRRAGDCGRHPQLGRSRLRPPARLGKGPSIPQERGRGTSRFVFAFTGAVMIYTTCFAETWLLLQPMARCRWRITTTLVTRMMSELLCIFEAGVALCLTEDPLVAPVLCFPPPLPPVDVLRWSLFSGN